MRTIIHSRISANAEMLGKAADQQANQQGDDPSQHGDLVGGGAVVIGGAARGAQQVLKPPV